MLSETQFPDESSPEAPDKNKTSKGSSNEEESSSQEYESSLSERIVLPNSIDDIPLLPSDVELTDK